MTIEVDQEPAERAESLVNWPAPIAETETTVTFDLEGAIALEQYRVIGEGNTALANIHADTIDTTQRAAAHLVDAGKAQRQVADLRAEILVEERRAHAIDKISYWLIIAVLGFAAL